MSKDIRHATLGDIGPIKMCKRVLKSQTNTTGGIPFYKIATFGNTADTFITEELYQTLKSNYSFPKKGAILISAAGTLGRTVIYDGNSSYFQDSNIVWIEHDERDVTEQFLYYYYQLAPWKKTSGSTIDRLYNDNIRNTPISYPQDIAEQKKITSILQVIDQKIELNNKINAELETLAKTIYDYWFVQFEFPDENGKPYKSNDGEMEYNEQLKREIPVGWEVKSLGEICKTNQLNYSQSDNWDFVNYLDTSNLTNNKIDNIETIYLNIDKLPSRAKRKISHNDIVFSTVRPNQNHHGIIKNPVANLLVSTGFTTISHVDDAKINELIYTFLIQDFIQQILQTIADTSVSSYPSINTDDILNLNICIPNESTLLKSLSKQFCIYYDKIDELNKENQQLTTLRDWLLPMLMNGQVTIK